MPEFDFVSNPTLSPSAPEQSGGEFDFVSDAAKLEPSAQEYAQRSEKAGSLVGRTSQEHADLLRKRGFGDEAVKRLTQRFEVSAAAQRAHEAGFGAADVGGQFLRTGLGFADVFGAQGHQKYAAAVKRFKEGNLQPGDADTIAQYEEHTKIDQAGTILGSKDAADIAKGILGLPKIVQETMAGGMAFKSLGAISPRLGLSAASAEAGLGSKLLTDAGRTAALLPLAPSMWWSESQQKNLEAGRQANDIRGFGPGLLHGYANLFVLGRLQQGITGAGLGTVAKKGVAGVLEQGLVDTGTNFGDAITSQIDKDFGKNFKVSTGYGTFENLVSGKAGEALKQATGQFLTFAVFAGLHRGQGEHADPEAIRSAMEDVSHAAAEDLTALKKAGYTEEAAGRKMVELQRQLEEEVAAAWLNEQSSKPYEITKNTSPSAKGRSLTKAMLDDIEQRRADDEIAQRNESIRQIEKKFPGGKMPPAEPFEIKLPGLSKKSALAKEVAKTVKSMVGENERADELGQEPESPTPAEKPAEPVSEKPTDLTQTPPPKGEIAPEAARIAPEHSVEKATETPAEAIKTQPERSQEVKPEVTRPEVARERKLPATSATKPPTTIMTAREARNEWADYTQAERDALPKDRKQLLLKTISRSGLDYRKIKPRDAAAEPSLPRIADAEAKLHDLIRNVEGMEPKEAEALVSLMGEDSSRMAGKKQSASHQGILDRAERAFEKLKAERPEPFGKFGSATEFIDWLQSERRAQLSERQKNKFGEKELSKMRSSPLASETSAFEMLNGKIAGNAPGEKISFGAMGAPAPEPTPETKSLGEHLKESAARWVNTVKDWMGRLAGQTAPKTTRLSEKSGDAIAHVGAARQYATALSPHVLDRILPLNPEEPGQSGAQARDMVGGVMVEQSLRHAREVHLTDAKRAQQAGAVAAERAKTEKDPERKAAFRKEAESQFKIAEESAEAAKKVGSIVNSGRTAEEWEANPFKTEKDFQEISNLPWVQEAIQRYEKEYVPLKEQYFRTSQGMDPEAEIDSKTQIPGRPIYRLHLAEGETRFNGNTPGVGGRGNITAQRARKLSQSKEASGAGYYEIDLGKIIEADLTKLVPNSAKAEMYRTMAEDKVGRWAKPGERAPEEGWKKIPDVRPPKGTQEADKGQTDFWVHPDAYQETRQVLGVDEPASAVPIAGALAKATLASTVEAAYHTRNLISLLTKPGMNPLRFIKNVRDVISGDQETMQRIVELTEIGGMKEHGFESASFGGKYNPLTWLGKAMTVVDRSMRLTADHAFDTLAKRPGVDGSESARRDFINQLGNYNKLTQNKMIAWLRDTGLGPFATAGSNFYMQGLRSLTLSHGLKTTSREADLKLRGEMLLRMATLPALAAGLNYLLWGRFDGDDKTPIAGLKIGESGGKTSYLDLGGLIGVTRGMRETGLLAMAEGMREGATRRGAKTGDWIDRAFGDIATSALHPAIGPPVAFLKTLMTGENTLGSHVAPRANLNKGESQAVLNAYAALFSVNPVLESWLKPIVSAEAGLKEKKEPATSDKLFKMAGPFGVKTRGEAPGAPHRETTIPVLTPQQRATRPKK